VSVVVQPRVARRLIAAGAAAIALLGLLLVLLVATLTGGPAPPNTCAPGAGSRYAPSPVALAAIRATTCGGSVRPAAATA
jgi:hypothetical protein